MYANYIIDDNSVYEIDDECSQNNKNIIKQSDKTEIEQEQVTFSAYI